MVTEEYHDTVESVSPDVGELQQATEPADKVTHTHTHAHTHTHTHTSGIAVCLWRLYSHIDRGE